ncbi:hypothetical protein AYL99_12070 [Fonsecaea erecta]|uniref:Uncharacterized protein n=1 Tax=Fonsecaea erecta TaxID=1367422 RepID=A0A178Z1S2_9EURO|nr:hypothetical protein AYL99_12070 [Fonsecaea erecta]OAP53750.1 hypothetical protein AYL99_12070 [Fonsecaea erecta]
MDSARAGNHAQSSRLQHHSKDNSPLLLKISNPDILIVLADFLSHKKGGVQGDDDLFLEFDHLLRFDQAEIEDQYWVRGLFLLPVSLRLLSGINLKGPFFLSTK